MHHPLLVHDNDEDEITMTGSWDTHHVQPVRHPHHTILVRNTMQKAHKQHKSKIEEKHWLFRTALRSLWYSTATFSATHLPYYRLLTSEDRWNLENLEQNLPAAPTHPSQQSTLSFSPSPFILALPFCMSSYYYTTDENGQNLCPRFGQCNTKIKAFMDKIRIFELVI